MIEPARSRRDECSTGRRNGRDESGEQQARWFLTTAITGSVDAAVPLLLVVGFASIIFPIAFNSTIQRGSHC